ncbi:hypothetical protein [Urbifossiella limnaea]|uniref:Uncharacterized protein n=1 Tax=Urbifossiella limnaea TaxID=2528023 RepID=A0A517XS98_9BACT|nr:hypothetical protein [Urbifossiella limnaea]QDU20384.1 hypothetical protein ETAA1_23360 [Urbifossiella limnaea]
MKFPSFDDAEALKAEWTDKYVRVREGVPEYTRFAGMVGRVVTVNYGGRALVDFADGAWYDIPATAAFLEVVTAADVKFDATANSAQKLPTRQS